MGYQIIIPLTSTTTTTTTTVMHTYKKGVSDALHHDLHIWIGSESSQDEYGTAAYKMVEADDFLGGTYVRQDCISVVFV
jgi:hypothetical protein